MSIYKRLGIRTVINGNATLTRLGGSIMPPEVVEAMADAAKHFVDIVELQKRVGEEIAKLHPQRSGVCLLWCRCCFDPQHRRVYHWA